MDSFVQNLLQDLECPICLEYMIPPITVCINGHNICRSCKPLLEKCPKCRGNLMETRNRPMENLSHQITHPCKYRKDGCALHVLLDFKETHEEECIFSPRKCPLSVLPCPWIGQPSAVGTHMQNVHNVLTDIPRQLNLSLDEVNISLCFIYDTLFFCCSKTIRSLFHVMVMFQGSQEEANNYKYRVTIKADDDDNEQFMSMCLTCPSVLEILDVSTSILDERAAVFSRFHCQKFVRVVDGKEKVPLHLDIIKSVRT